MRKSKTETKMLNDVERRRAELRETLRKMWVWVTYETLKALVDAHRADFGNARSRRGARPAHARPDPLRERSERRDRGLRARPNGSARINGAARRAP
jgi:hypothetical protein